MLGDCAYGAGETRAQFAEAGRTLIAQVPDPQNQGYFAKTHFQIDLEAGTCTCPNQHQAHEFRPTRAGGGTFVLTPTSVWCVHCEPNVRAVGADGRCRSTRTKPYSNKLEGCSGARHSLKFGGGAG